MPNIGAPELIVILVIALIVLGPKRLPEVGKSVGKGMREFKASLSGMGDDEEDDHPVIVAAEERPAPPPLPEAVAEDRPAVTTPPE